MPLLSLPLLIFFHNPNFLYPFTTRKFIFLLCSVDTHLVLTCLTSHPPSVKI